jgi:azurin
MKILKPVSILLMMFVGGSALAADCSAQIEGNDAMQFNKTSMTVPAS